MKILFNLVVITYAWYAHRFQDGVFLRTAIEAAVALRQWDRIEPLYEDILRLEQAWSWSWVWHRYLVTSLLERMDERDCAQLLLRLFALEDRYAVHLQKSGAASKPLANELKQQQHAHRHVHRDIDASDEFADGDDVTADELVDEADNIPLEKLTPTAAAAPVAAVAAK